MEDIDSPSKKSIIQPVSQDDKRRLIRGACLLAILIGLTIWLALSGHLQTIIKQIVFGFESKQHLRTYLKAWGAWAPVVFIALQALQVVVAPIPGELTGVVGGFLFGSWRAVAYSSLGLTVGSAIAFLLARLIGLPFVKLFVPRGYVEKLDFLGQPKGEIAIWALFIVPGFPKDVLSYLLGLTPLPFLKFIIICALGRLPGTVLLGLGGAALYKENWNVVITLVAVCLILAIVFYYKGQQISSWIQDKIQDRGGNNDI